MKQLLEQSIGLSIKVCKVCQCIEQFVLNVVLLPQSISVCSQNCTSVVLYSATESQSQIKTSSVNHKLFSVFVI